MTITIEVVRKIYFKYCELLSKEDNINLSSSEYLVKIREIWWIEV